MNNKDTLWKPNMVIGNPPWRLTSLGKSSNSMGDLPVTLVMTSKLKNKSLHKLVLASQDWPPNINPGSVCFFFLCGSSSNGSPQKKEPEIYRCWSPQIHRSWTQNYKEFLEDGWKNGWSRGCTLCETAMGFCWKATHVPWIAESFYDSFYGIWALWYLQSLAGEHVERWQEGPGIPLLRKKLLDFSWVWLAHLTGLKSVWICNPS